MVVVLRVKVPEPGPLIRSARCVGFRIEPEDEASATIVAKPNRTAKLVDRREVGSDIADAGHVTAHAERGFETEANTAEDAHGVIVCGKRSVYRGLSERAPAVARMMSSARDQKQARRARGTRNASGYTASGQMNVRRARGERRVSAL